MERLLWIAYCRWKICKKVLPSCAVPLDCPCGRCPVATGGGIGTIHITTTNQRGGWSRSTTQRILRLLGITLISPAAVFDGVCRKDSEFAGGIYLADSCSLPRKTNPQCPQYMKAIDVNKDPVKADNGWLWQTTRIITSSIITRRGLRATFKTLRQNAAPQGLRLRCPPVARYHAWVGF